MTDLTGFDSLQWQSPKALRGKDSDPSASVDFGEGAPSRWSFVPEEAYEKPPQFLAAQEIADPLRDVHEKGRFCGHTVMITINRGGAFCCENCRKDWEGFTDRVKHRIARHAMHERYTDAAEIFQAAQKRRRAREQKEQ